jgi:hypothetical protein
MTLSVIMSTIFLVAALPIYTAPAPAPLLSNGYLAATTCTKIKVNFDDYCICGNRK